MLTLRRRLFALDPDRKSDNPIVQNAWAVLCAAIDGSLPGSVGEKRTRLHAACIALDRIDGKPVQTVSIQAERQPGTVIIGDPDSPHPRTVPLSTGPPN